MPEEKVEFPFKTAPRDPRYPNTGNAGRYCFQMYYDYHRCIRLFNAGYASCNVFKKNYTSLCPNAWIAKWDEQIKNGTFARELPDQTRK